MHKVILSPSEVRELISENKYKIDPKTKFISRCIDGRYESQVKSEKLKVKSVQLPALAIPGADAGQMAVIFATANIYGFNVDEEKVFQTICEVVGGVKNLRFHTDEHADTEIIMEGCGYIRYKTLSPEDFNVTPKQVEFIKKKAAEALKKGAVQEVLLGDHKEGAILVITGPYGVYPGYALETSKGRVATQVFEFHKGLVDERQRVIARELVKNKAVELFAGTDEEYLYEVLSSTTDDHLMEIAKRLVVGLPLYTITFEKDGDFAVEETDKIQ